MPMLLVLAVPGMMPVPRPPVLMIASVSTLNFVPLAEPEKPRPMRKICAMVDE
jgi:hypothetical protein